MSNFKNYLLIIQESKKIISNTGVQEVNFNNITKSLDYSRVASFLNGMNSVKKFTLKKRGKQDINVKINNNNISDFFEEEIIIILKEKNKDVDLKKITEAIKIVVFPENTIENDKVEVYNEIIKFKINSSKLYDFLEGRKEVLENSKRLNENQKKELQNIQNILPSKTNKNSQRKEYKYAD